MNNEIELELHGFDSETDDNKDKWMMTFADLLSLLLVFFILIYATSSVKNTPWQKLKKSMGDSFKPAQIEEEKYVTNLNAPKISVKKGIDLDYLMAVLESKINKDEFLKENISLGVIENSLVIKINGDKLFEGNSPIITEDSRISLFAIGVALQRVKNKIEIFGYVDKDIETMDIDNWSLILSRAVKVASIMREYGNLSKLEAIVKNEKNSSVKNNSINRIDIIVRPYINNKNEK